MNPTSQFLASARRTIEIEFREVKSLLGRLDGEFERACHLLLNCRGRVVVTGMGKSGHIARKIAATLASTGTPAMFIHPGEASHGDLGMITDSDLVIALSNSGTTDELMTLLPVLKRRAIPLVSMTGNPASPLAKAAEVRLDVGVSEEACPLGLAPTSSTTVALVLGDALAMALLEARGFTSEDFAVSHPGGRLGRRLLLKVSDIMHSGENIPRVPVHTALSDALLEITRKGFGLTTVSDEQGQLCGVFSDGDLRRAIDSGKDIKSTRIETVMSRNYKHITENALAAEAAKLMQDNGVYALLVKDEQGQLTGIVKMHDLLQANVV
ncbi:MAG: KpsF/GutQ family sugar-phosphate isomerase [Gammaproteobacteria bacterium]|nr:KpsF/GutQ family sugar-phosphate isomerase [Pseudomonadales bacterium]MCP5345531.1 KpsF/GutQ family sugar-phosphate isomerase [Pseudomonadales bacterium]